MEGEQDSGPVPGFPPGHLRRLHLQGWRSGECLARVRNFSMILSRRQSPCIPNLAMTKILRNLSLVGLAAVLSTACAAGPHQLQRTVDDWSNQNYVNSPVMNGILHVIPVIPVVAGCAAIGDFFITDAAAFWLDDAWDGQGTAFRHLAVTPKDGAMESLLIEGSGWLAIQDAK